MKKRAAIVLSLFTGLAFCAGALADNNARLVVDLVQPIDDVWDHGFGADAQFRIFSGNAGLGFSIGVQRWDIDGGDTGPWLSLDGLEQRELNRQNTRVVDFNEEGIQAAGPPGPEGAETTITLRADPFSDVMVSNPDVDGHATVAPLGISGLLRIPTGGPVSVVVEGGIRYLIIESSVEWSADFVTVGGSSDFGESGRRRGTAKIDNAIVGILGVDVIVEVSREISLIGGIAVQFDIEKASVESPGTVSVGDIEMGAVSGHAGVLIRY